MSRVEDFDSEYWSDPVIDELSLEASHLYIWTWTNDRVGAAGLYKATRRAMSECKVPEAKLDDAWAELAEHDLAFYDGTYVWVKARVKRIRTRTVAMCKGVAKAVAKVPEDNPFRVQFMARYGGQVWRSGDAASTIAQEMGLTGVPGGSHPSIPALAGKNGYPQGKSSTYKGKGNGKGQGKGPLGRGAGEGRARLNAFAAEHFPGENPLTIGLLIRQLTEDGQEPTVEAIEALLDGERAA